MGEKPRCSRCGRAREPSRSYCGWCGALLHAERCKAHPTSVALWACAICGTIVCRNCRCGNRHVALCETHSRVRIIEGWAEVDRTTDEPQAEVVAETLRAAELDAEILSQKDHANVVGFGGLAVVRILVPAFQYDAALAAIDGGRRATGE